MLPLSPLRISTIENPILRTFKIFKILRFLDLTHLEINGGPIEPIFRKFIAFCLVFMKPKRCATSVRSFSRWYRALNSAMCQKTKVSVLEKRPYFRTLTLKPGSDAPGACLRRTPHRKLTFFSKTRV